MELSKHYVKDWAVKGSVMSIASLGLFLYSVQFFDSGKKILIQASNLIGRYDTSVISPFEMYMYDFSPIFMILFMLILGFTGWKIIDGFQLDNGIELLNSLPENSKSEKKPEKINEFQKVFENVSYYFNKNQGKGKQAIGLDIYYSDDLVYLSGEGLWVRLDKKNTLIEAPSKMVLTHQLMIKISDFSFKICSSDGTLINKIYQIFKEKTDQKPTNKSSSADELKKFKELLDSEAISQEEYDAKKKELLSL